jgi:hypothetical protein
MTAHVHECLALSVPYSAVGKTPTQNPPPIFVLRLPERETLSTRIHPRPKMTKETPSR